MKVTIDRDNCISCAACWQDCPEVFEESLVDGFSEIVVTYRVEGDPGRGEVPANLDDCVRRAADGCPVEVISVE